MENKDGSVEAARAYRSNFKPSKIVDAHLEDAFQAGVKYALSELSTANDRIKALEVERDEYRKAMEEFTNSKLGWIHVADKMKDVLSKYPSPTIPKTNPSI